MGVADEGVEVEVFPAHLQEGLFVLDGGTEKLGIEDMGNNGTGDDAVDEILALRTDFDEIIPAVLATIGHILNVAEELRMLHLEVSEGGDGLFSSWLLGAVKCSTVGLNLRLEKVESSAYLFHVNVGIRLDQDVLDASWQHQPLWNGVPNPVDMHRCEWYKLLFFRRFGFTSLFWHHGICRLLG